MDKAVSGIKPKVTSDKVLDYRSHFLYVWL